MSTSADSCSEFRALASCRLDGELDELEAARLDRHLGACAACRSWTREVAVLAEALHGSESALPALPAWSSAGRAQPLRRFVRVAAVGATAASAAAVAAFALALPGSRISVFSSGSTHVASAPCASCTKKQALTFGGTPTSAPITAGPVHVTNPLVQPETAQKP